MSVATGSTGLATFLEAIPGVIGGVASIVGIVYSTILILSVRAKRKIEDKREVREDELHAIEMRIKQKELDRE